MSTYRNVTLAALLLLGALAATASEWHGDAGTERPAVKASSLDPAALPKAPAFRDRFLFVPQGPQEAEEPTEIWHEH